jgi:hypothetical protein
VAESSSCGNGYGVVGKRIADAVAAFGLMQQFVA